MMRREKERVMKNRYATILFFWGVAIHADTINLHNETNLTLYAAPYYTYTSGMQRVSEVKPLYSKMSASFERPPMKWDLGGRALIIYQEKEPLKEKVTPDIFKLLSKQDISNPLFSNFYVALVNNKLSSFNPIEWRVIEPILHNVKKNIKLFLVATIHRLRMLWSKPPYNTRMAYVEMRPYSVLCQEEYKYLSARRPRVNSALKKLGITVAQGQEPIIALCASGGGIRSTIAFNGAKIGLAKAGLLDTISYESTLSGSTWETAPSTHFNNTPPQYKEFLKTRLPGGLINTRISLLDLSSTFFKKLIFDKPLSMIDLYGGALTALFLDRDQKTPPHDITLVMQADVIANGSRPMPIYNAITSLQPYVWTYFTPYEVGSHVLNGFIPPWALGRKFNNSASINYVPGESLGYLLGTFGYAIGVNLKEVLTLMSKDIESELVRKALEKISHETSIGTVRLLPAEINNFTFGMIDAPYGRKEILTLLDAGIHYNLPMPPLLEKSREVDVIIVCDNSAGTVGEELHKTEEYFRAEKMPFPSIDYRKINNVVSVFEDQDRHESPIIIYVPLVKNANYSKTFDPHNCPDDACNTFNFTYTSKIIDLLSGLTEFTIVENKDRIVNAIKDAINRKVKRINTNNNSVPSQPINRKASN